MKSSALPALPATANRSCWKQYRASAAAVGGKVQLNGKPIDVTGHVDPRELRDRGLGHVPEDRHHVGLVLKFEEAENGILGYHHDETLPERGLPQHQGYPGGCRGKDQEIRYPAAQSAAEDSNFSGGNQQKIVLAREMERGPDVLIIGQPTRGVDVGAIEFIHKRIIEMRDQGMAVLLVSVELDEIRALSDRIIVMFAGRVVGERDPDATEGELGLLMAGVEGRKEAAE